MHALDALGNPVRRALLMELRTAPLSVGELAAKFPVSRPAVSRHLRMLEEAGLVEARSEGTRSLYAVRLQGFASVTATNAVADPNVALNDPASGLAFKPTNGSFVVSVYDSSTKQIVKSQLFSIDLDGLDPSAAPGVAPSPDSASSSAARASISR